MVAATPLTKTRFEPLTDALGVQYSTYLTIAADTAATAAAASATANIGRITAITDKRTVAFLLQSFIDLSDALADPAKTPATVFQTAVQRIQSNVGALDAFCLASGSRVSRAFADLARACGVPVSAKYVYNAADVILAELTVTGAGALTFAAQQALDPASYGPAPCVVELVDTMASGGTLHLTMVNGDGSTTVVDVTVPAGATSTDPGIAIGGTGAAYLDCTAATITDGSAATVRVVAPALRTPAA